MKAWSFNPSVGIAFIQTCAALFANGNAYSFNPSVGIAFIQTRLAGDRHPAGGRFNPSVGIAFIQTRGQHRFTFAPQVSIPQSG